MKKLLSIILIFIITTMPVSAKSKAKESTKIKASMLQTLTIDTNTNDISFKINEPLILNEVEIPSGSTVNIHIDKIQKEKHFHKNGYFIFHISSYTIENTDTTIDLSDKKLYFVARKYYKIKKGEATFTSAEFGATTAASWFVPGVDLVYYFIKGAIQNQKGYNRIESGVGCAYENFLPIWLFQKGRHLELNNGDNIVIIRATKKYMKELEKAEKKALKEAKLLEKQKEANKTKNIPEGSFYQPSKY